MCPQQKRDHINFEHELRKICTSAVRAQQHGPCLAERIRGPSLQTLALVRQGKPAVKDALRRLDADGEQLVQLIALLRVLGGHGRPHVLGRGQDRHVVVREHLFDALRKRLVQVAGVCPPTLTRSSTASTSSRKKRSRRARAFEAALAFAIPLGALALVVSTRSSTGSTLLAVAGSTRKPSCMRAWGVRDWI